MYPPVHIQVRLICIWLFLLAAAQPVFAQPYTWVFFKDKGPEASAILKLPASFLSGAKLQRHIRQHIPVDERDLPVSKQYLNSLAATGVPILGTSRWLNAALVVVPASEADRLRHLYFVDKLQRHRYYQPVNTKYSDASFSPAQYSAGYSLVRFIGADALHNLGFTGTGVNLAVFDSGFFAAKTTSVFSHIFIGGRLLGADDVLTPGGNIYQKDMHGSWCLSVIAAKQPDFYIGAAPDVNVYLARTEETSFERHTEELAWAQALENADMLGVQVVSSSVSYNTFDAGQGDYTYSNLNGRTTIITQAAQTAADKGILVVNSAGNEGNSTWRYINAPCDADTLLCVGAVSEQGNVASFSSRGPTVDGRIKPDVVALGNPTPVVQTATGQPQGTVVNLTGTSFAAPAVAGLAACLIQAFPTATPMQVLSAIRYSSSRAAAPDNNVGYGIPNGLQAYSYLKNTFQPDDTQPVTLKLYPVPSSSVLSVWVQSGSFTPYDLTLFDGAGRAVQQLKGASTNVVNQFELTGLPAGIYFVSGKVQGVILTQKVIVAR